MSFWDTDQFKEAWNSLSKDDKKHFQSVGELMYNTLDYETGKVIDASPNELQELLMAINSGLIRKREDLDGDELKLLQLLLL